MLSISKYVFEKLKLNSKVEFIEKPISTVRAPRIYPEGLDVQKMSDYRRKGSKPERLIATIKNNDKLAKRFAVACGIGWNDAAYKFGDALVNRGIYTQEEVDAYIDAHLKK